MGTNTFWDIKMQQSQQHTKILGQKGEAAVVVWLQQNGFVIIARNFQIRAGEIDIIASKNDLIVFVEVKTRMQTYFPISTVVTFSKQKCIVKTAQRFVLTNNIRDKVLRFDVATVTFNENVPSIQYIENAFMTPF